MTDYHCFGTKLITIANVNYHLSWRGSKLVVFNDASTLLFIGDVDGAYLAPILDVAAQTGTTEGVVQFRISGLKSNVDSSAFGTVILQIAPTTALIRTEAA